MSIERSIFDQERKVKTMTDKNEKNNESGKASGKPKRETILSGMQPTGALHIGNLEGALANWIRLQESNWFFACIVDLHALTADWKNPQVLKDRIFHMTVDFLAAGLDPDKCAIFVQSEVKEHAELHLIFPISF